MREKGEKKRRGGEGDKKENKGTKNKTREGVERGGREKGLGMKLRYMTPASIQGSLAEV